MFLKPSDINSAQAAVEQEQRHVSFSVLFLAEIEKQLDAALKLDSFLTPPASPEDQTAEGVLSSIRFKLHRFSDVYLVVDDIDCLWVLPKEYLQVEEHLEALRSHGVRVLVTSRIPFRFPLIATTCDVRLEGDDDGDCEYDDEEDEDSNNPKHSHDEENDRAEGGLVTWWSCDQDDHEGLNVPFFICSNCKTAGFGCGNSYVRFCTYLPTYIITREWYLGTWSSFSLTLIFNYLQVTPPRRLLWDPPSDNTRHQQRA